MAKQQPHADYVAVWGAVAFGAILASYSVLRPVRDALALEGDPDKIPWLFSATFVAMVVVSPVWSAALLRFGRRRLVPPSFHVFAACAIVFAILVALAVAPVDVGRAFYVWASVFNLFVVSVFWSLLADLLGPTTARSLYGPIAAGGTVGALVGPTLTKGLVGSIGVEGVLVVSAALLELAVIAVHQVRKAGEALERAPEAAADRPRTRPELSRDAGYLAGIAIYVLCTAVAATFMYFEQAHFTKGAFSDKVARTEFFALLDLGTNLIAFALQTLVAARLLKWIGPGLVMIVLPIAQAFGITMFVLAPSVIALAAVQITTRSATHALTRPARELLFTVIEPGAKYWAKNAIDTIIYRFGDVSSAWLFVWLTSGGDRTLLVVTAPLVAMWIVAALWLGHGFRRRTQETA